MYTVNVQLEVKSAVPVINVKILVPFLLTLDHVVHLFKHFTMTRPPVGADHLCMEDVKEMPISSRVSETALCFAILKVSN